MPVQGTKSAPKPPAKRRTAPHVPGRITWFTSQRGTIYYRVDVSCIFCGAGHAHNALGPRVSGCDRGLYVIDAPVTELSGGGR
jgi:hypothetical protein